MPRKAVRAPLVFEIKNGLAVVPVPQQGQLAQALCRTLPSLSWVGAVTPLPRTVPVQDLVWGSGFGCRGLTREQRMAA